VSSVRHARRQPEPGLVEVWHARLDEHRSRLPALAASLSADERERADRFRRAADREAFVLRRGLLRELLGSYLELSPAAVEFTYGRWDKPSASGLSQRPSADGEVCFNASSSGDHAVFAFARGRAVGIDVERMRDLPDMDDVAARIMSAKGVAAYRAEWDSAAAFYAVWTQKEAYVKALGDGFAAPLDAFDVPVRVEPGTATIVSGRRIEVLPAPPGYAAAVAADGSDWSVRYASYDSATRLGTTIAHASRTSSRISAASMAASRTHAQLYLRSERRRGIANLSGSDATSASRHSFGNAKPIIESPSVNSR
jgi:4'-phosphopantetheinyl transferase